MATKAKEIIDSMVRDMEKNGVNGLDKLSEAEARILSIESFMNAMLEHEDNDTALKEIAFRTLVIMAFGSIQSGKPEVWTDFLIDCVIVAPTDKIKMALREVTESVFKAYIITMTGDDMLTPLMDLFMEETDNIELSDEDKAKLEASIREVTGTDS